MDTFLLYIFKSSLLLAVSVSLFMAFMSRETYHRLNRYMLLGVVVSALFLPLVNVGIESPFSRMAERISRWDYMEMAAEGTAGMEMGGLLMGDVTVDDMSATPPESGEPFNWLLLVSAVYIAGVVVLLVRQLVVYIRLVNMIRSAKPADVSQYGFNTVKLRVHNGGEKPFSWFRWVVISAEDLNDGGREILSHETAHVNAGHSWDIVLADAVIMLQWFNPMAWIMKNCLKDIHEFEADEAVINSGVNAREYQLLIIKKAVGSRLYSIANSFNHSLTKKRITMMCKEKSNGWSRAKALYILPVAAIAALSFSTVENVNASEAETASKVNEFVANDASKAVGNYLGHENTQLPAGDNDEKVFQVVEKAPEFPGGVEAMMRYLSENIRYPEEAKAAGKEGRAIISFVVKKDGSINDVTLLRTAGMESLDNEALRVIASMPKWNPGMQGGKAVNVKYTIPVVFKKVDTAKNAAENGSNKDAAKVDDKVFNVVEKAPEFPEGMEAMQRYFAMNTKFPAAARKANVQGRVIVQFVVAKDGSITKAKAIKSSFNINQENVPATAEAGADGTNAMDELTVVAYSAQEGNNAASLEDGKKALVAEALRVVENMPKWKPGMQGGEPVNVQFMMPVTFHLR